MPPASCGITSSRCTNEETFLVQKLVRAAFGTNNVDTCARGCHSPTGYGLKNTLGESAGTQAFDSVMKADVVMIIGANPTDGHPVFASQLKRRLRQGAKLIIADPREIALVRTPHIEADAHLQLKPGTNVALLNALAHVVVTEGLVKEAYVAERCEPDSFAKWRAFVAEERNSPEASEAITGVPAERVRRAARLYATAGNSAIYYGLGVTEHSQGTTAVMGIANLAMATGNLGREGVGVSPLRGQNNVQGSCDMGSFPHEFSAYRHVSDPVVGKSFEEVWGVQLQSEPGLRIPNMFEAALDGTFKGMYVQGEDFVQSDPNTHHVSAAMASLECVIVQDLFLNEVAKFAHVFLPGSSFLEKDGTFTNAERRTSLVRKVIEPLGGYQDWQITCLLSEALGYPMHYEHASEIMEEIARLTPTFAGMSFEKIERLGSIQWPCNDAAPEGTPTLHVQQFVRGKGKFWPTEYVPTSERSTSRFPLILTTGRILTQYNVGAQTRRTNNVLWHTEDVLEIHPHDAEVRGVSTGTGWDSPAAPARPCCAPRFPRRSRRAWCTPRSISRRPMPTSSRPRTPTGRPTAPSTRSPRSRWCWSTRRTRGRSARRPSAPHPGRPASASRIARPPERSRVNDRRATSGSGGGQRGTRRRALVARRHRAHHRPGGGGGAGSAGVSRGPARRDAGDARGSRGLRGRIHAERRPGGTRGGNPRRGGQLRRTVRGRAHHGRLGAVHAIAAAPPQPHRSHRLWPVRGGERRGCHPRVRTRACGGEPHERRSARGDRGAVGPAADQCPHRQRARGGVGRPGRGDQSGA